MTIAAAEQTGPSLASLTNDLRHWERQADWHYFPPGADWPALDREAHARCLANAAAVRAEIAALKAETERQAA